MEKQRSLAARHGRLIAQMGVEAARHPLHFAPQNDGSAHVAPLPEGGWLWQVTENGRITAERRFADDEALLYRLACTIAESEGARYQAGVAVPGQDPRRADFAHRLELVGRASPEWRVRLAEELSHWLARHPYADTPRRARLQRNDIIGLGLVGVLVLGWAGAHYPLWSRWQTQQHLANEGVAVRAQVIDRQVTDGRFADVYSVTYRFEAAHRRIEAEDVVDWQTYRRVEPEGSGIDIRYDPHDPQTSMVDGNNRAGRLAWIYLVIDSLLALVILRSLPGLRKQAAAG